jgi:integrase
MLIHVKGRPRGGGKRRKDRYTLLSQATLETLRAYWRQYHPQGEWPSPARTKAVT